MSPPASAFVRLSVHAFVAYIANKSRTHRPSVPKFGRKFPPWRDSRTSLNIKRLKLKVTRPINADTHRAPYLPNGKAYELGTWYTDGLEDDDPHQPQAPWPPKGQGRKVTWWVWAVLANAVPVSLEAGGGIPCRPNPAATLVRFEMLVHLIMFTHPTNTAWLVVGSFIDK